ncbi:MAG TPA: hypothetical protein VFA33_06255 [Bryobacteraceae bacterium]|nr:hypothetical protein [Bryobacteraceae bacterium]
MIYGREALRQYREQEQAIEDRQAREADLLSQIPADAPMDDATLCVWNGERFVAWDKWLATRPVYTDDPPPPEESKAAPVADPRPRASKQQKGLW